MRRDPRVLLSDGVLLGREERGVLAFRGVPFARSGSGGARFRAPEKPRAWSGTRDATRAGRVAPQPMRGNFWGAPWNPVPAAGVGEDCLSLNVWTPALDGAPRPVMVWIHGGGYSSGAGNFFLYSGERLARRGDVVVVTINYRLGPFGGLDLSEFPRGSSTDSNPGLRDQIAALDWVGSHIADFGGDPENVTLFGQSAGAMSVGTLMAAPAAAGLFRRAILQSGAADNVHEVPMAREIALNFCKLLAIDPERRDAIERLRGLSSDALVDAQIRLGSEFRLPLGTLAWQPVVDGDLIPARPLERIAAGVAASIPTLIGTNRDEWKMFTLFDRKRRNLDEATLRAYLGRTFAADRLSKTPLQGSAEWVDEVVGIFGRACDGASRDPSEAWIAFQGARVFHFPAVRLADAQSKAGAPTWVYRFDGRAALLKKRLGACHALEVPFVFGSLRAPWLLPWLGYSPAARNLSDEMQDVWVSFARKGRPSPERSLRWPGYHPNGRATVLGGEKADDSALREDERNFFEQMSKASE